MPAEIVRINRAPQMRLTLEYLPCDDAPNTLYLRTGTVLDGREWDVVAGLIRDLTYELVDLQEQDAFLAGLDA